MDAPSQSAPPHRLQRTYLLRGLDRKLYRTPPIWPEGTFIQDDEETGQLILHVDRIASPKALTSAIATTDQMAERFRLAVARRTGCPLTLRLAKSKEPNFDPPGLASVRDTVKLSDRATCSVVPRDPPTAIEQLPEAAARWILTLTEAHYFNSFPGEVLKRLYLLIEELKEEHADRLGDEQRAVLPELKWLRDFVSHPVCRNQRLCEFIASHLPNAVISTMPWEVRFDRTNLDHRNFVGGYDPKARSVANTLLDTAIGQLE
ncbi:MAG TPA: hypothetical protein VJL61_01495 [Rhodanobacteraceae bacterium]|jgi:hypothetical protein|nr:hypothetical protein [Rhodanobacteraceae bacterium]